MATPHADLDWAGAFGIPYAGGYVVNNQLHRKCPACGEMIAEDTDPTGELETNNYGAHFARMVEEEKR